MSLKDLPRWRLQCFSIGASLLGFGIMVDFVNGQIHFHSLFAFLGSLLLISSSVLCLFGKGWVRIVSAMAGVLLAVISLLGG